MQNLSEIITCSHPAGEMRLQWFGEQCIRVSIGSQSTRPSHAVIADATIPDGFADEVLGDGSRQLGTAAAQVRVSKDGSLEFLRHGEPKLVVPSSGSERPRSPYEREEDQFGAAQRFQLNPNEAIYGLGQVLNGKLNWRGQSATLIHGNVTVVVPFMCSSNSWGILWDNPSHTEFKDNDQGMHLWSDVADAIDYYVVLGDQMDDIIAGYRALTGAAPLFPRQFYGLLQSKERYKTADELVEVCEEHAKRDLPVDVIIQDWQYWGGMDQWSGMRVDQEKFGDLAAASERIHAMDIQVMISIWPLIGEGSEFFTALDQKGFFYTPGVAGPDSRIYDAYNPEARELYWEYAKKGLFELGVDAWWMDGTEPEYVDCHDPMSHKHAMITQSDTAAGSWARVLNAYSLATTRGVYEGQRATTDEKRVFILTRSAWAGQQRYASATWSGDISANWETFEKQIPAGLNFCLAGIPYWTTDTGAFFTNGRGGEFSEGVNDPAYRELFLRWYQYSCFCPLMRAHGTQTPREIWHFGQPGETIYDTLKHFAELRRKLMPYSYSLAAQACFHAGTPMRALAMDYADDPAVYDIPDQFSYGPAFMVAPILEPMVHAPSERLDPLRALVDFLVDGKPGLEIKTFSGVDSTDAVNTKVRMMPIDCNWSGGVPAGVEADTYRMEFAAMLVPDKAGRDVLIQVTGRVRVYVDGDLLIDDWPEDSSEGASREHRLALPTKDQQHHLRVVYGHGPQEHGQAVLRVGWDLSETVAKIDPNRQFRRNTYIPAGTWYDFWTNQSQIRQALGLI